MTDDSNAQDATALPPKLNLRKQGVLKQDPAVNPDAAIKQETSRLVIDPAPEPVAVPAVPVAIPVAARTDEAPAIKLQPLKPKPIAVAIPVATVAPVSQPVAAAVTEDDPTKADAKRKTSRIPLGAAKPNSDGASVKLDPLKPRTIKIKPAAPLPKILATQPLSITAPIDDPSGPVDIGAEKRKTSRIALEGALRADKVATDEQEAPDPAQPRTIRIKRPGNSEAATVRLQRPPEMGGASVGETARLDNLPIDIADDTPTRKKTIRVKRPPSAGGSTGPSISIARTAPPVGLGLVPPEPLHDESDEPGVAWALVGIAATLVLGVVIYMLAAQAVGPNLSGTQLSSWKDGPNLTWPGKILN